MGGWGRQHGQDLLAVNGPREREAPDAGRHREPGGPTPGGPGALAFSQKGISSSMQLFSCTPPCGSSDDSWAWMSGLATRCGSRSLSATNHISAVCWRMME